MMRAAVVLWIVSAVICVGRSQHHEQTMEAQNTESSNSKVSLVTSANKEFAFHLYRKLVDVTASPSQNIFCSPVSVSVALAALSVGAQGETHQQIFSGLGFNTSQQTDVDQAFRTLLANMVSHPDINAGTAVFIDNKFQAQPTFLDTLKQFYSAEGFQVDFTKMTDSANTINKYVAEKTNGKIKKVVHSVNFSPVMYLISYIYYKGLWKTPFDPALTSQDDFHLNETNKVPVQMMKIEGKNFETYIDEDIKTSVLHLPFSNSYSMLLLLPENMAVLENALSPAHVSKWMNSKMSSECNIYVPKFSIKTSHNLKDVLTGMGMTNIFNDRATFSGISGGQLFLTEVVQQAALDVDEAGASATVAIGGRMVLAPQTCPKDLKFNHPFMVIITEHDNKNILFLGKVVNPNI